MIVGASDAAAELGRAVGFSPGLADLCARNCAEVGDPPCHKLPELTSDAGEITPCQQCVAAAAIRGVIADALAPLELCCDVDRIALEVAQGLDSAGLLKPWPMAQEAARAEILGRLGAMVEEGAGDA